MKKRVWSRIISIILTFAMAFSLFATPVSAASANVSASASESENWAIHEETIAEDGSTFVVWITRAYFRDYLEEKYPTYSGDVIEAFLDSEASKYEGTPNFWNQDIPSNAYVGISYAVDSSQVFWYTEGVWEIVGSLVDAGYNDLMDITSGMVLFSDGTKVYPIGYTGDRNSTNSWAVVGEAEGYGTLFMTESYFRKLWVEEKESTGVLLEAAIIGYKNKCAEEGTLYTDTFPSDAMWGFSPSGSSEIFWYAEDFDTLETGRWRF